MGFLIRF